MNRSGHSGFEGYYGDAHATEARTRNGWYWTGDLAYRDNDGFFYFAGRRGDWLRVDSENLTAGPIERVLVRYEPVATVAVYSVPDPRSGDQVMAAVELLPGRRFGPAEFAAFLEAQPDLGTKWVPAFVRVTGALPQTASGRVTKDPLRGDGWWQGDDPVFRRRGAVDFRLRAHGPVRPAIAAGRVRTARPGAPCRRMRHRSSMSHHPAAAGGASPRASAGPSTTWTASSSVDR